MLEAERLSLTLSNQELFSDVSFRLEEGDLKILFGPSGSGKSSLLRVLGGFISPDRGTVYLDGETQVNYSPREWRRQVVMLHQEPRMFPGSVERNVKLAPEYHGFKIDPEKYLRQCELDVDMGQDARTLSGGEKKRLSLARALAVDPRYLLLDEPTASLDKSRKNDINELFQYLVKKQDLGVIWVTHDQQEAKNLGSEGYLLDDGEWRKLNESDLEGDLDESTD